MILVTSGAYVAADLRSELGPLPPAMLPIGNRRLFQHQAELLARAFPSERRFLSLPEGYGVSANDHKLLSRSGLQVVRVPEQLSLADSLLFVLNAVGAYDEPVRVLHGDTLLEALPTGLDTLSVAATADAYDWEYETPAEGQAQDLVWCGYFAFGDPRRLIRALVGCRHDFVAAVRSYDTQVGLQRVQARGWKDFGHSNTYHKARMQVTTERAFNALEVRGRCVTKRGEPASKIRAESRWFRALPGALKVFTPQLLDWDDGLGPGEAPWYQLEYLCQPPLNELFVHGANPPMFWRHVFGQVDQWFAAARRAVASTSPDAAQRLAAARADLIKAKSLSRLRLHAARSGLDLQAPVCLNGQDLPPLWDIAQDCIDQALRVPGLPGVVHGDLCLSNMLFDSRSGAVKLIDPRGVDQALGEALLGDLGYDIAKLTHSVIGLYDGIVAGIHRCQVLGPLAWEFHPVIEPRVAAAQALFLAHAFPGAAPSGRYLPQAVLLFLSMLPLHADCPSRQATLLANALRLYQMCRSTETA